MEHRRYYWNRAAQIDDFSGTAFYPDDGGKIINWPHQHYERGVRKNRETGNRFKYITRVIKRLRYRMEDKSNRSRVERDKRTGRDRNPRRQIQGDANAGRDRGGGHGSGLGVRRTVVSFSRDKAAAREQRIPAPISAAGIAKIS